MSNTIEASEGREPRMGMAGGAEAGRAERAAVGAGRPRPGSARGARRGSARGAAVLVVAAFVTFGVAGCSSSAGAGADAEATAPAGGDRPAGTEGAADGRGGASGDPAATATAGPSGTGGAEAGAEAGASSAFAITGDPATDCEALIGGRSAGDLSPNPENAVTRYEPLASSSFQPWGPDFPEVVGPGAVNCLGGTANSEWSAMYGYASLDAAHRDSLAAWIAAKPGVVQETSNGRTVSSWTEQDYNMGDVTLHFSVGDADAVYSYGDIGWAAFPDL